MGVALLAIEKWMELLSMNSQFRIMRGGGIDIHNEVGRKDPKITEIEYVLSIIRVNTKRKNQHDK